MSGWEVIKISLAILALLIGLQLSVVMAMAITMVGGVYGCLALKWTVDMLFGFWDSPKARLVRQRLEAGVRTFAAGIAWPFVIVDRWLRRISQGRLLSWPRWLFYMTAAPTLAGCFLVAWALEFVYLSSGDRPDIANVLEWQPLQIGNIADSSGQVYFRMYNNEARRVIRYEDIPPHVRDAFIAAENGDFWDNDGWNKKRTAVAIFKAVFGKFLGYRSQGGSTITQQVDRKVDLVTLDLAQRETGTALVSDGLLTRAVAFVKGPVFANRTARKWREIKRSHHLETALEEHFRKAGAKDPQRKAKEAILTTYLNAAYFGHGVYGIDYAAEFFFQKKLNDLTVPDAARLASLLPAPNHFAQLDGNDASAKTRRDQVLHRMADEGLLDTHQLPAALATPVKFNVRRLATKTEAPAAVNTILYKELPETGQSRAKLLRGSIQIQTTLRMDVQRVVNAAAKHGLYGDGRKDSGWVGRYPGAEIPQVAIVVLGPRGDILAMYGGEVRDPKYVYNAHQQLNRALALEQPGSTFKIVDGMAAMAVGFTPDTRLSDADTSVCMRRGNDGTCIAKKWISNYESEKLGVLPLREFSARSVNTAYMRLMQEMVGDTPQAREEAAILRAKIGQPVDPGAAMAVKWGQEMGIATPLQPYISTVLGGSDVTVMDMANVIRTAGTGQKARPYLVSRITNNDGAVLYENTGTTTPLPVEPEQLQMLQELLYGNVRLPKGTGHSLDTAEFGIEVAGKTGTSDEWRDGWYCGYDNGDVYACVHIGYDNNQPMPGEGLPIWRRASGGWVALPIFREIMTNLYGPGKPFGPTPPKLPDQVKDNVNAYLAATYPTPDK